MLEMVGTTDTEREKMIFCIDRKRGAARLIYSRYFDL